MGASLKTAAVDLKAAAARRLRRSRPPAASWKSRILAIALLATAITAVLTGVDPLSPTISFLFPPCAFSTSSSAYANSSKSLLSVAPPPPPFIRRPILKRTGSRPSPIRSRGSAGVNYGAGTLFVDVTG
ncbi:putative glycosyltransferase [Cocos nucifera]|uniref:Putative glycosyltransferase n=1 Tax=Cocos nucifera TaxID=13894 RepID=A0A8K0NCB5_COCNU|nr:putative glycosyltransferase [Cocos nucifera]